MASALELRTAQKQHLIWLLKIKKDIQGQATGVLHEALEFAVATMEPEDVAYCEKIIGIKAL